MQTGKTGKKIVHNPSALAWRTHESPTSSRLRLPASVMIARLTTRPYPVEADSAEPFARSPRIKVAMIGKCISHHGVVEGLTGGAMAVAHSGVENLPNALTR